MSWLLCHLYGDPFLLMREFLGKGWPMSRDFGFGNCWRGAQDMVPQHEREWKSKVISDTLYLTFSRCLPSPHLTPLLKRYGAQASLLKRGEEQSRDLCSKLKYYQQWKKSGRVHGNSLLMAASSWIWSRLSEKIKIRSFEGTLLQYSCFIAPSEFRKFLFYSERRKE